MSAKEIVIEVIRQLPDDVSAEDVLYELYVRLKVEEGIRQADSGEGITHEEARQRFSRWLIGAE